MGTGRYGVFESSGKTVSPFIRLTIVLTVFGGIIPLDAPLVSGGGVPDGEGSFLEQAGSC